MRYKYSLIITLGICFSLLTIGIITENINWGLVAILLPLPLSAITSDIEDKYRNKKDALAVDSVQKEKSE